LSPALASLNSTSKWSIGRLTEGKANGFTGVGLMTLIDIQKHGTAVMISNLRFQGVSMNLNLGTTLDSEYRTVRTKLVMVSPERCSRIDQPPLSEPVTEPLDPMIYRQALERHAEAVAAFLVKV
jgi:hypothetical protein